MADANPFQDPLRFERRVPPCAIVIFGANGDLTKRKLLPALYRLAYERRIPQNFAMVGNSRTPMSDQDFRQKMKESVQKFIENSPFDESVWESFEQTLYYVSGDLKDARCYQDIQKKLAEAEQQNQTGGNVSHRSADACGESSSANAPVNGAPCAGTTRNSGSSPGQTRQTAPAAPPPVPEPPAPRAAPERR